jgi:hypothetical protein
MVREELFYIFTVGGLSVDIVKIFTLETATSTGSNHKILYRVCFTCNVNSFNQEGEYYNQYRLWTSTIWQHFPLKSCILRHHLEDSTKWILKK